MCVQRRYDTHAFLLCLQVRTDDIIPLDCILCMWLAHNSKVVCRRRVLCIKPMIEEMTSSEYSNSTLQRNLRIRRPKPWYNSGVGLVRWLYLVSKEWEIVNSEISLHGWVGIFIAWWLDAQYLAPDDNLLSTCKSCAQNAINSGFWTYKLSKGAQVSYLLDTTHTGTTTATTVQVEWPTKPTGVPMPDTSKGRNVFQPHANLSKINKT